MDGEMGEGLSNDGLVGGVFKQFDDGKEALFFPVGESCIPW